MVTEPADMETLRARIVKLERENQALNTFVWWIQDHYSEHRNCWCPVCCELVTLREAVRLRRPKEHDAAT